MSELFCEEIAHRAGFAVSVGNWITPEGALITGKSYETHHWETIKEHLGHIPDTDNHLRWMNEAVGRGYIRLVFRSDVLFQVECEKEEIWGDGVSLKMMRLILGKIPEIEVHIFSRKFYIIGTGEDILEQNISKLQIQEA